MKFFFSVFLACSVVAAVAGCASGPVLLEPQLQAGQEVIASEGTTGASGATSKQMESIVSLETSPKHDLARYGLPFTVSFFNGGTDAVPFGPSSITVMQGGEPLEVLSMEKLTELQAQRRNSQIAFMMLGAVAMGAAQAMQARGAARTPGMQPTSANSANSQQYSEAVSKQLMNGAQEARLLNEQFGKIALADISVDPLKTTGGFFIVRGYLGTQPVVVTVKVRDESHSFTFRSSSTF